MSTHPFVNRLRSLDRKYVSTGLPQPEAALKQLERKVGHRLPDDYRACVLELGPFELIGEESRIVLETIEVVVEHVDDEVFKRKIPGMLVIGADAGGQAYYYDPTGKLGYGNDALFMVGYGVVSFEWSCFIAPTLAEAVEAVIAGESFYDRPMLGKQKQKG